MWAMIKLGQIAVEMWLPLLYVDTDFQREITINLAYPCYMGTLISSETLRH